VSGLEIDFESRSTVDLLTRGAYIYAAHPSTLVLLASYRLNGVAGRWRHPEPCPPEIRAHVEAGGMISAHNSAFERLMWWLVLARRYGWPKPRLEQFRCTATTAAALSLPRSLDRLGAALDLDVVKDKRGKALIKLLSLPQGWTAAGEPIWNDDPGLMEEFHAYCDQDVAAEAAADTRMVPLPQFEQDAYVLSERINDRGIRIDVESAQAALVIIEKAKARINAELIEITGGAVTAVTQAAALGRWIAERGVALETMDKDTVEETLFEIDDLPPDVRRVLELRQEGAKPSVEKIGAMLQRVCTDGRARGVYVCHGAGQTGRFSSRGLQAHNMPKYRKVFEAAKPDLETLMWTIRQGDPELLEFVYGHDLGRPLHILSDAVRSFIVADPGKVFINADFTSIEGVMSAWFADEHWKLDAFRALLAGTGPGMYELLASGIYSVDVAAVTKAQRSVGKVGELSMGYQGGVGALARMARANKLKLPSVFGSVWESADPEAREKAESRFEERLEKHDGTAERLGREGWIAGELIKVGWRIKHPAICAAWANLDAAMTEAVVSPGTKVPALNGRVSYLVAHGFLWCRLPSGRCLAYGRPRFDELDAPWADKTVEPTKREKKRSVTVLGVDPTNEKWTRFPIYGGSLFNNVVQGSSRDILVHGMQNVERAGYPIVLHTHDESQTEVPVGFGSVAEFERLMCDLPAWARGAPIKASGWMGRRYKKD
jgi:DNA polymerase